MAQMIVSFDGSRITIDGNAVTLEVPIWKVLVLVDRIIVLFAPQCYPPRDDRYERNIVALDRNGCILWRIEKSKGGIRRDGQHERSMYAHVRIDEREGGLKAYEVAGLEHDVDPDTGAISNTVVTK